LTIRGSMRVLVAPETDTVTTYSPDKRSSDLFGNRYAVTVSPYSPKLNLSMLNVLSSTHHSLTNKINTLHRRPIVLILRLVVSNRGGI
jgi:hypothetical protein